MGFEPSGKKVRTAGTRQTAVCRFAPANVPRSASANPFAPTSNKKRCFVHHFLLLFWANLDLIPEHYAVMLVLIFPSLCLRHNCGAFVTVWSRCARPHLLIVAPTRKQIIFVLILFLLEIKIKHRHRKTKGKICSKNLSLLLLLCFF